MAMVDVYADHWPNSATAVEKVVVGWIRERFGVLRVVADVMPGEMRRRADGWFYSVIPVRGFPRIRVAILEFGDDGMVGFYRSVFDLADPGFFGKLGVAISDYFGLEGV